MKPIITSTLFLLCSVAVCSAQKIQIKDGTITVDKTPVAKIEGEATMFKGTHIKVKSLNDELLIAIDSRQVIYRTHFLENLNFTKVTFAPFNETINRLDMHQYSSEKKIIGFLYDKIGKDFLTKDGLNKAMVLAYTTTNDETKLIHEDSVRTGGIVSGYLEGLKQPVTPRNTKASLRFEYVDENTFNWKGYEGAREYADKTFLGVYQDNVLIGGIVKIMVREAVNSPNYNAGRYFLLRKITPFKIQDETFEYAPLALLRTYDPNRMGALGTEIRVENEGMRLAPKVNNFQNAEGVLVETLISEGLL